MRVYVRAYAPACLHALGAKGLLAPCCPQAQRDVHEYARTYSLNEFACHARAPSLNAL